MMRGDVIPLGLGIGGTNDFSTISGITAVGPSAVLHYHY
jgi:hypothetical protein